MIIHTKFIDAPEIQGTRTTVGSPHTITLFEKELCKIRAILTCNPSNESRLHSSSYVLISDDHHPMLCKNQFTLLTD
jgi:hypothetical protein